MKKKVLIITGPTGVGKTDFVSKLVNNFSAEIINADIGQMYTPLTIGTAKPDWKNESVQHHLFDIINDPKDFSINQFRNQVEKLIQEIWARDKTPIIVGGSTLYIKSLFFIPACSVENPVESPVEKLQLDSLWTKLNQIDPIRASKLHANDYYRLQRALDIWYKTGVLPSQRMPQYKPIAQNIKLFILNSPKLELYARNDLRVCQMMEMGWLDEVANLSPIWHDFLKRKKIIGYETLLNYLDQKNSCMVECIKEIQQRVRRYAKKQQTFWRSLQKELALQEDMQQNLFEIDLTLLDVNLYIKQLLVELKAN